LNELVPSIGEFNDEHRLAPLKKVDAMKESMIKILFFISVFQVASGGCTQRASDFFLRTRTESQKAQFLSIPDTITGIKNIDNWKIR
jgi:hypothetical protein